MAETDSRTKGQGPRRNHHPRLTIVIGTNGAGKSTWCSTHENELPAAFYDADSIANSLGDWNDRHNQIDLYDNSGTTYRQIAVLRRHGIEQVGREPPEWAHSLLERIGNMPLGGRPSSPARN